ncbi:MAG: hypothetical protein R8G33_01650 [Gammaproteobacteria bacterium]|nr:hypothetical protein [Gammaproteobacteria bacterium]
MLESRHVHQQLLGAIDASEKIIDSLNSGELEEARKYDDLRADFIRSMSKCQNFSTDAALFIDEIGKLAKLDKVILRLSGKLRDEVLTEIRKEQSYRLRHVQYAENLQL